ncbi:MAG: Na/Pi cotransporter family protein [Clostridia bacterium]|nr:Na/Pi cotransporter family protein [Clostridia bacterium]
MTVFDILTLICGLSLFLFGMNIMGDSLKRSAGSRLKVTLGKMTSTPLMGFLLGLGVTAIIQSSSATTVMVVGFVNSAVMTLSQSVAVIMGANVGTAVTSWLTALSSLGGGDSVSGAVAWLTPDAWMPILALAGLIMIMVFKRGRKRDIGMVLLGFSVLMVGMSLMSGAVSQLKDDETFTSILTMFKNPFFGILAGMVLTVIVQSSSASIGILQSLTMTGAISFGAAIPIIMGQNIGTCVTALISSVGAGKNGKRAALVHLYFNVIGVIVLLSLFYILNAIFHFAFLTVSVNMWGVAGIHTVFKILSVLLLAPFGKLLEKLAVVSVPERHDPDDKTILLDKRLLATPDIALERAEEVARDMAVFSFDALRRSMLILRSYSPKEAEEIRKLEEKADLYEDALGTYLVEISGEHNLSESGGHTITKLLRLIGDFERISDHSVNLVESAEEIRDKKMLFSDSAHIEVETLCRAIDEIMTLAQNAFLYNDLYSAALVEPLEETVEDLEATIRENHIRRVQKNECTTEHGFILSNILTDLERVASHCSNIAGCVSEISRKNALDMHHYASDMKAHSIDYDEHFREFSEKYKLVYPEKQ